MITAITMPLYIATIGLSVASVQTQNQPTREKLMKRTPFESSRHRGRNKHHLTPKKRGGDNGPANLLLLNAFRHMAWHILFGQKTLEEVIRLLQRVHSAKNRCAYKQLGCLRKCPLTQGLCTRNGHKRQASNSS